MNDAEDRQRIVSALAMHAFGKIAEGEEVRVYDVRTDSMWLVGRKNDKLAWRKACPADPWNMPNGITPATVSAEIRRLAGDGAGFMYGPPLGDALVVTINVGKKHVETCFSWSALMLSLDEFSERYLRPAVHIATARGAL